VLELRPGGPWCTAFEEQAIMILDIFALVVMAVLVAVVI
jgi:hypothetical protein